MGAKRVERRGRVGWGVGRRESLVGSSAQLLAYALAAVASITSIPVEVPYNSFQVKIGLSIQSIQL